MWALLVGIAVAIVLVPVALVWGVVQGIREHRAEQRELSVWVMDGVEAKHKDPRGDVL